MSYFSDNYSKVSYPKQRSFIKGLRNAQIGAIHSIASHFTVSDEPAIVVLPTGAGKTAVLMMSAFVLEAKRVLVVTPSRLVRNQIFEDFSNLKILKILSIVPIDLRTPKSIEIETTQKTLEDWEKLREYDVVITTPNSASPAMKGVSEPPGDLFDLILVDEAHHSPAKTWANLMSFFSNKKQVLFTATPYRTDKKEIKGKFVYTYSVKDSFKDGNFGKIEYIKINENPGQANDITIAKATEIQFLYDRQNGYEHFVFVRTDKRQRASELLSIYKKYTSLKLISINSNHSLTHIKRSIEGLKNKQYDGVICVDMLGEGFDFPNLKIAAIHAPHKSLPITLQFIGRFARKGSEKIGTASFLAIPHEIEFETEKLYAEGAIWQEIVPNLSDSQVQKEKEYKILIETFEQPKFTIKEFEDLSLYSVSPYRHVKILQTYRKVDIKSPLYLPKNYSVVYWNYSESENVSVIITNEFIKQRWSELSSLVQDSFELFVVYFDYNANLLFISASYKSDIIYEAIANSFTQGEHGILPLSKTYSVLADLTDTSFFNIGMKNRLNNNISESYRIIAGSQAQDSINETDGKLYDQGHIYGKGKEDGKSVMIGYSSGSKVWSQGNIRLPVFLEWCKHLAKKISDNKKFKTGSGLDNLSVGQEITSLPKEIVSAEWFPGVYNGDYGLEIQTEGGSYETVNLLDTELTVSYFGKNESEFMIQIVTEKNKIRIKYQISDGKYFYRLLNKRVTISVTRDEKKSEIIHFLTIRPISFYLSDFSRLVGNELFPNIIKNTFDKNRIKIIDWDAANTDIERETDDYEKPQNNKISIHEYVRLSLLKNDETKMIIYDHRQGEIADFITLTENEREIVISLFHCKKSGGKTPGDRVNDLYEVVGQVIKSVSWIGNKRVLFDNILRRLNSGSKVEKGNIDEIIQICNRTDSKITHFQLTIVQPGISKNKISEKNCLILAACDEYVRRVKSENIYIWGSE